MIAKRIPAPKASRGFTDLARYVVNAKSGIDPASWERLGAYVLDENGQGEKVAWARVTNCMSDDPGWATREILATQARNTRSQSDKSYHLVVSFPEGERPTREQMEDIEDRLCEAIGFGEHQRVSAVHRNTDNWHLHIAINKVHPHTFKNPAPYRDHFRLQQACAELEIKHGLTVEPHTLDHQQARGRKARGRAADFEAHHGGQSFASWVQEHAREALLDAKESSKDWQDLHRVAAAYDLVVKPRGAGMVIAHKTMNRLAVKASEIDRGLSAKALVKKFGPYEAPNHEPVKSTATYIRPGSLYDQFLHAREAAAAARKAAETALRDRHLEHTAQLKAFYDKRFQREQLIGPHGFLRRNGFQILAQQRRAAHAERREHEREDRRRLREMHPVPSWKSWLEAEAAKGNAEAEKALGGRQRRVERIEPQVLQAENAAEPLERHRLAAARALGEENQRGRGEELER